MVELETSINLFSFSFFSFFTRPKKKQKKTLLPRNFCFLPERIRSGRRKTASKTQRRTLFSWISEYLFAYSA